MAALLRERAGVAATSSSSRRQEIDVERAARRDRRQAPVRQRDRGCAARRRHRPRGAQQQRPARHLPDGLAIGAVLPREDARDAIVLPADEGPAASKAWQRASASVPAIRHQQRPAVGAAGPCVSRRNVRRHSRQPRYAAGKLDSRRLRRARPRRCGLAPSGTPLPYFGAAADQSCVPAPGQGIIAVEIGMRRQVSCTDLVTDRAAHAAFDAERAVVTRLGGGCQMPIGAYAVVHGDVCRS